MVVTFDAQRQTPDAHGLPPVRDHGRARRQTLRLPHTSLALPSFLHASTPHAARRMAAPSLPALGWASWLLSHGSLRATRHAPDQRTDTHQPIRSLSHASGFIRHQERALAVPPPVRLALKRVLTASRRSVAEGLDAWGRLAMAKRPRETDLVSSVYLSVALAWSAYPSESRQAGKTGHTLTSEVRTSPPSSQPFPFLVYMTDPINLHRFPYFLGAEQVYRAQINTRERMTLCICMK